MGYIRHEMVIAITTHNKHVIAGMNALRNEMAEKDLPNCVLGPCDGINATLTYFFAPDGSKEGWDISDICDEYRKRFVDIAKIDEFGPTIVEMRAGGDDMVTIIDSTTDIDTKEDIDYGMNMGGPIHSSKPIYDFSVAESITRMAQKIIKENVEISPTTFVPMQEELREQVQNIYNTLQDGNIIDVPPFENEVVEYITKLKIIMDILDL